jgi:phage-related protein
MPAPYPIFPYNAGWENPIGFEAKPIEIQYGKGGTQMKARRGINNVKRNFQVQFIVPSATRNTIEAFLTDLGGRLPFWFYWESLGTPDQSVVYTCPEWQWVPVGTGAWQFQGTFKQVYRW